MHDPTYLTRFGLAVQADLLRQAAADRRRSQARMSRQGDSPARLAAVARRLTGALRAYAPRRGCRAPMQAGAAPSCRAESRSTGLTDDR